MKKTHKGWSWLVLTGTVLWLGGSSIVEGSEQADGLQTSARIETELITHLTDDVELAASLGAVDVVRQLYGNAQELLVGSGHEVSIQVDDLMTFGVDQFERHKWTDMVTVKGSRLQIEKVFLSVDAGEPLLHVRAEWHADESELPHKGSVAYEDHEPSVAEIEALFQGDALPSKPADEHTASGSLPEKMETLALSTYSVVLQAEGVSRSYRAAMFWRRNESGELKLNIQDNVLTPVESIAFETAEATPHLSFDALFAARPDLRPGPSSAGASSSNPTSQKMDCLTTTDNKLSPFNSLVGYENHLGGFHEAVLQVNFQKSCNGNCQANCAPTYAFAGCHDSGPLNVITKRHKIYAAYRLASGGGHLSATCGGALQCAIKECHIGFCGGGVSLGINWNGSRFNFSGTTNTLLSYDLEATDSGGCLQFPDDPPNPPCGNIQTGVSMLAFEDDAPSLALAANSFELTRSEPSNMKHHGEPVTYAMGEWALVDVTAPDTSGRPEVAMRKASSAAFGLAKTEPIHDALGLLPSKSERHPKTVLIVEHPTHEDNSRAIPMPDLRLETVELGSRGPVSSRSDTPRRIMVRADFGEQRQLQGFDVIHDPIGLGEQELEQIRDGLSLEYQNDDTHRVVVFAVLELGERVEIERTLAYLPKCCCTGQFCV